MDFVQSRAKKSERVTNRSTKKRRGIVWPAGWMVASSLASPLVAANEDVFVAVAVVHDRGILTTRVCPVTRGQSQRRRVGQGRGGES